jgi:hypothetical protein
MTVRDRNTGVATGELDRQGVIARLWWSRPNEFARIEPPMVMPGYHSGTRTLEMCVSLLAQVGSTSVDGFEQSRKFQEEIHDLSIEEARLRIEEKIQEFGHTLAWENC